MSDDIESASNAETNGAVQVADAAPAEQVATPEVTPTEPAKSAREAVERAVARIEAEPEKPQQTEAKPAEPERKTRNPNHGPDGKFAKKPDAPAAAPAVAQPVITPELKAPPRFAKAAQDAWGQTPEPVRQEVERALTELSQGIEKYKPFVEAFEPIRKYHDMATQSGTTLDRALDAYVGIEQAWRQSPSHGFVAVCRNMGVEPTQMLQAVAQGLNGANASVPRGDSPEVAALKQELSQLKEKFGTVEKTVTESQQQYKQRESQMTVESFAKSNPHFDELATDIAQMLETGYAKDLPDAYGKALRLNPEVSAKIEAAKKPAVDPAQTRGKAALSITGSPATGSTPESRKPAGSIRDALNNAMASVSP